MSTGDFERFLSDLQDDAGLRDDFQALDSNPDTWVRWANAKGYSFTRDEATRLADSHASEISDDDLEKVAGGWCGDATTTG
ncbi:MAG TPA: Nif11-like leader peptide family RiPP precursor [Thermoanaerobaculia bacterium]